MIRSCMEVPAHWCSSDPMEAASSSAFSSVAPTRRSRLVSSFVRIVMPNRWNGDVASSGGSWNLAQFTAPRRVLRARFTVATS